VPDLLSVVEVRRTLLSSSHVDQPHTEMFSRTL
jgi:hypothetical protein